jgi:hypothetical protein
MPPATALTSNWNITLVPLVFSPGLRRWVAMNGTCMRDRQNARALRFHVERAQP